MIPISAWGIDSGGANTQDVYHYGASRRASGCVILKGASRPNRPIISAKPSAQEIDWGGQRDPTGAELWMVGTDVAKDWIFARIELPAGPGALHFHKHIDQAWFEQLLAERKIQKLRGGNVVEVWHKDAHVRNEALDLCVYSLAIAFKLRLDKWSALDWARLRKKLIRDDITPDLFAAPIAPAAPENIDAVTPPALQASASPAPPSKQPAQADVVPFLKPPQRRRTLSRGIT